MDPITTAIFAAINAGLLSGISFVSRQTIMDSYSALKKLLKKKFGDKSDLLKAVTELEKKQTEGRRITLEEEIRENKIDKDKEINLYAKKLLETITEQLPDSSKAIGGIFNDVEVALLEIKKLRVLENGTGMDFERTKFKSIKIDDMKVGSGEEKDSHPKGQKR